MVEEYLTIPEIAERLKVKPKTIKNKMATGIFKRGVHYFRPQGLGPRFKWSAVVQWLEQSGQPDQYEVDSTLMSPDFRLQKAKGLDIGDDLLVNGHYVRR